MKIFCLPEFKTEFEKLKKKNSYKSVEPQIIQYFFNKSVPELCTGVRLNNSDTSPYIKKRLEGSGGFRVYYLLIIKDGNLYLMFLHPKTGPMGADNIKDESKALLYKKVLEAIKSNQLFELTITKDQTLQFNPLPPKKKDA